jgi:hypothetical protein
MEQRKLKKQQMQSVIDTGGATRIARFITSPL